MVTSGSVSNAAIVIGPGGGWRHDSCTRLCSPAGRLRCAGDRSGAMRHRTGARAQCVAPIAAAGQGRRIRPARNPLLMSGGHPRHPGLQLRAAVRDVEGAWQRAWQDPDRGGPGPLLSLRRDAVPGTKELVRMTAEQQRKEAAREIREQLGDLAQRKSRKTGHTGLCAGNGDHAGE